MKKKLSDQFITAMQNTKAPAPADTPAPSPAAPLPGKATLADSEAQRQPRIPAVDIAIEAADTALTKSVRYKEINPARCRPWSLHDRTLTDTWLTSEACGSLADSIRRDGQQQLGLVRPIVNDPDYDYEIIFGLRRSYACKLAGVPFKARVTDASDAECVRFMVVENTESEDISEIERALSCRRLDEAKIFDTKGQLAEAHGISGGLLTRRIKAAGIYDYPELLNALQPLLVGLSVRAAADLIDALSQGDDDKKRILARAQQLADAGITLPPADNIRDQRREAARLADQLVRQILKRDDATPSEREQRVYAQVGKSKLVTANFKANGTVDLSVNTRSNLSAVDLESALQKAVDDIIKHARKA